MTTVPPADVTSDDKLWSLLSYIFAPLVGLILLLMEDKKSRPFIKYHAVCSLVLGIVCNIILCCSWLDNCWLMCWWTCLGIWCLCWHQSL